MFHEEVCPRCHHGTVICHNHARKLGGLVGAVAGTITGARGASVKDDGLAGLAGILIAALLGATAGLSAGTVLGSALDDNVLNNFQCLRCGHRFSHPHVAQTPALPEPSDYN